MVGLRSAGMAPQISSETVGMQPPIIHGDIKAVRRSASRGSSLTVSFTMQDNILVDKDGVPLICDFGVSRMMEDRTLWMTTTEHAGGTIRWQAPELIREEQRTGTESSDVYAFGMTSLVSMQLC